MNAGVEHWQQRVWSFVPRPLREPLLVLFGGVNRWLDASGPQFGASIAFYTMFALAPLLVITIAIAGAVLGPEAARGEIVGEFAGLVGPSAGRAMEVMIEAAWREPGGLTATIVGIATLLLAATGVFGEVRRALNAVGHIIPTSPAIATLLRVRLIGFALLLGLGFLAVASLLLSAVVSWVTGYVSLRYPVLGLLARGLEFWVSFGVLTLAFSGLLRWLPDRAPSRRSLWISALVTSALFSIGKTAIGLYLGRTSVSSAYGAAGSFVVVMLWVYYSSQILLFGAAIGRVYDERRRQAAIPGAAG
jgi:membrane protein